MQAVVIGGPKKSGKTMLLALIAEALERRGKRVAVVKYSGHPLEKSNTDAFWLMRDKRIVVSASPEETAVFWPELLSFENIASHIQADVLLLEGGDAPLSVPRVLCFRENGEEALAFMRENGALTILATVGAEVPSVNAPYFPEMDPMAAEKIAAFILDKGARV